VSIFALFSPFVKDMIDTNYLRSETLEKRVQPNGLDIENSHGLLPLDGAFLDGLHALSGKKTLDRVSNHPDPPRLIKSMSSEDFFWLIKKVGADGSLALLKLASTDQWQYILDVESWHKDRLELNRTGQWMQRLLSADPKRFIQWLFSHGQGLAYYYFCQSIVVEVKNEDEGDPEVLHLTGSRWFSLTGSPPGWSEAATGEHPRHLPDLRSAGDSYLDFSFSNSLGSAGHKLQWPPLWVESHAPPIERF